MRRTGRITGWVPHARPPRILIVSRDGEKLAELERLLSAAGFATLTATGAVSAVATARREQPRGLVFDLARSSAALLLALDAIRDVPGLERLRAVALTTDREAVSREEQIRFDYFVRRSSAPAALLDAIDRSLGFSARGRDGLSRDAGGRPDYGSAGSFSRPVL